MHILWKSSSSWILTGLQAVPKTSLTTWSLYEQQVAGLLLVETLPLLFSVTDILLKFLIIERI